MDYLKKIPLKSGFSHCLVIIYSKFCMIWCPSYGLVRNNLTHEVKI